MTKTHLTIVIVGAGAAMLLGTGRDAYAAPPAQGATPPMSIQPTGPRPLDSAGPPAAVEPKSKDGELAPNAIYAEGLGAGIAYSFNYERIVTDGLGVRAGLSYLSMGASATTSSGTSSASATFMTFPITASYIGVRSGKHALELGGGGTLLYASATGSSLGSSSSGSGMGVLGTALVGYRIHPVDHAGFHFRVGAMALVGSGIGLNAEAGKVGMLPWAYLSMGAAF